jgi:hypothetical protein
MNAWCYTSFPPVWFHDVYNEDLVCNFISNIKNRINVDSGLLRRNSSRYNFKVDITGKVLKALKIQIFPINKVLIM